MKEKKRGFFGRKKKVDTDTKIEEVLAGKTSIDINTVIENLMKAYNVSKVDLNKYQNPETTKNEECEEKYREIYEQINPEETEVVLATLINQYCQSLLETTKLGVHNGYTMYINSLQLKKALSEYKKFVNEDENLTQNFKDIEQKIKTETNFDAQYEKAKQLGKEQDEKFNSVNRAFLR